MSDKHLVRYAIIVIAAVWGVVIWSSHVNPCTANAGNCFSIQGLYSKPDCPGQMPETVEVDGRSFFLECRDMQGEK